MVGARTRVVDAREQILVPGYIDPHVHPATLTTPAALARFVLPLGTTAVVADTLQFWELGGLAAFLKVADALLAAPLRFYWMIRPHAQSRAPDEWRRFDLKTLARAMAHPRALAIGEVTRWPDAWRGDPELLQRLALARGGRVEGHTAGASAEKIAAIAAAGFTSDHEPITAQEVRDRARQGDRQGRPVARASAGASVAARVHVSRGAARGALAVRSRRLRAARPRALSRHQARQRGDQPARGATDGAGRSPRGSPGSRRTLGRAGRRRGLRRAGRRLRGDDQHRLQHLGAGSPSGGDGARGQPAPRPSRGDRPRRRRPNRLRAAVAARGHHDAPHARRGGRAGRRAAPGARRARLSAPRAALYAVLPFSGFSPGRAAVAARRLGRQAEPDPSSVAPSALEPCEVRPSGGRAEPFRQCEPQGCPGAGAPRPEASDPIGGAARGEGPGRSSPVRAVRGSAPRRQRRLALGVLLAAAALAVAVFPIRGTWWGGWILAIAEAGIVGGLADWFAVTAIFRRPLGLPIPHTALIPANWELMAARVGTMVGSRVLTKEDVAQEIARVDVASLIARAAQRLSTRDLDAATRELARWLAAELSPKAAGDLVTRLRDLLLERPLSPAVGAALALAQRQRRV